MVRDDLYENGEILPYENPDDVGAEYLLSSGVWLLMSTQTKNKHMISLVTNC